MAETGFRFDAIRLSIDRNRLKPKIVQSCESPNRRNDISDVMFDEGKER